MEKTRAAIALIAFDLDGTVFGRPGVEEVSPRLERAFKAAREAGVVLCAATGRPYWMLGEQLETAPWLDWAIAANGAQVAPMRGSPPDAMGSESYIPRNKALWLIDLLDGHGAGTNAHLQDRTLVQGWTPGHMTALAYTEEMDGGDAAMDPFATLYERGLMVDSSSVASAMRADPSLRLDKVDAVLPDETTCDRAMAELVAGGGLEVARTSARDLEITVAGVSKGMALGGLCSSLGMDEDEAVAFGDSGNDLSMAGRGATFVAMGNAAPEVKAAADEVCGTVLDDGVAVWIEEHVLGR